MKRADYDEVGASLLTFSPVAKYSVSYKVSPTNSITLSSPDLVPTATLAASYKLPLGLVQFSATPSNSANPITWEISPDLTPFNAKLRIRPLEQGTFDFSINLPVPYLNPALAYSTGAKGQSSRVTFSPHIAIGDWKLSGSGSLNHQLALNGALSLERSTSALRATFCSAGSILRIATFRKLPFSNVFLGGSIELPKLSSFKGFSLFAKGSLDHTTASVIFTSAWGASNSRTVELRTLTKIAGREAALLLKAGSAKGVEAFGGGVLPVGASGSEIFFRAGTDTSVAIGAALANWKKNGVSVKVTALFEKFALTPPGITPKFRISVEMGPKPAAQ
jgi:hypothetical protein